MSVIGVEKISDGIAIVSLKAEPVNMMGSDFWQQLITEFDALEADSAVRAVVFQSGLKRNVFAAGLDIKELYAKGTNETKFHAFWALLTTALTKIYTSPMMTVAAIKGQCPAGGCCLALCCDYRVITTDGSMGLNEVALGMGGVPFFWAEAMTKTIGQRHTERMISTGAMAPSAELLRMCMVDAVLDTPDAVLARAIDEAKAMMKFPDLGRATCKDIMRKEFGKRWADGVKDEGDFIWNSVNQPLVLNNIEGVLKQLSGGKAKKPAAKL